MPKATLKKLIFLSSLKGLMYDILDNQSYRNMKNAQGLIVVISDGTIQVVHKIS